MTRSTPLGVTLAAVLLGIEGLVVMAQGALSLLVALQFGGILGLALGGVLFVVGWVMLGAALGLRKRSPLAWRVALGVLGVTVVSSVLLVLSPSGQGPGPSSSPSPSWDICGFVGTCSGTPRNPEGKRFISVRPQFK